MAPHTPITLVYFWITVHVNESLKRHGVPRHFCKGFRLDIGEFSEPCSDFRLFPCEETIFREIKLQFDSHANAICVECFKNEVPGLVSTKKPAQMRSFADLQL